jgi:subtilisin-like proprotein convertase family protein
MKGNKPMKVIIPAVVFGFTAAAQATVFGPQAGGPIPDCITDFTTPGPPLVSTLAIGAAGTVTSVNSVTLTGLAHTWVGDLRVTLTAPNGDTAHLFARLGCPVNASVGNGNDLNGNYIFQDAGTQFGGAAGTAAVPAGTYMRSTCQPALTLPAPDTDPLTVFNGDPVTGNWVLSIDDWATLDVGSLASWSIDITVGGGTPCPANVVNSGTSVNRVDVDDLLAVIGAWGNCPAPPAGCPANIVNTGTSVNRVDVDDLLAVIGQWGPCPTR